jgi:carbonic anhydrase/acetyltransferase-like protein (isoleucine patch superfamily)
VIHPYRSVAPRIHPSVWVADSAQVIVTKIPPRSLVMGAPARVKREVIRRSADNDVSLKNDYLAAARMA